MPRRVPLIVWITRAEEEALAAVARARGVTVEEIARALLFPPVEPTEEAPPPWADAWARCIAELPSILDSWPSLTAEEREAAEGHLTALIFDHPEEEHPLDDDLWALHQRIADVTGFDIAAVWPSPPEAIPPEVPAASRYPPAGDEWWAARPCSYCGAPAGFSCITKGGKRVGAKAPLPHGARMTIDPSPPTPEPPPTVRLASSRGEIERVVVEDRGDVVMVCRQEELEAARRDGRAAHTIGFTKDCVVPPPSPPPDEASAPEFPVPPDPKTTAAPPAKVSDPPSPRPPDRDPGNVRFLS